MLKWFQAYINEREVREADYPKILYCKCMYILYILWNMIWAGDTDVDLDLWFLYQCSGMNGPAATAILARRPWARRPGPASLNLAPDCRRAAAHSAGRRCAPWRRRSRAGFGCGLSGNCYWRDPSQLIVIVFVYFYSFAPSNIIVYRFVFGFFFSDWFFFFEIIGKA